MRHSSHFQSCKTSRWVRWDLRKKMDAQICLNVLLPLFIKNKVILPSSSEPLTERIFGGKEKNMKVISLRFTVKIKDFFCGKQWHNSIVLSMNATRLWCFDLKFINILPMQALHYFMANHTNQKSVILQLKNLKGAIEDF